MASSSRKEKIVSPDYLYHYPCFKKVQLAAVKHQLYHPNLPTLRAMNRDNVMHKLPDDHCQMTTCETSANFLESAMKQPITKLPCSGVTETWKTLNRLYVTKEDVRKGFAIWSRYIESPALFDDRPEDRLLKEDMFYRSSLHFDGKMIRSMKPEVRSYRMSLTAEPRLDPRGYGQQQPTPSEIKSRYRHTHPIFFRDMSSHPWRDPDVRAEHPNPPFVKLV